MKTMRKILVTGVTVFSLFIGSAGYATAAQEIIAHRGLWKNYSGDDVAENSVSSYIRAKNANLKYVEIDLRMAKIGNYEYAIVFHDFYWDRAANVSSNGNNWGHEKFVKSNLTINPLSNSVSLATFDSRKLKRNSGNGYQATTNDRPLTLNQFLLETVCKYPSGPDIILDVQSVDIAEDAAERLRNGLCPSVNGVQNRFSNKVSIKLFATKTIPDHIINNPVRDITDDVVDYYSHGTGRVRFIFQFNSSAFDSATCSDPSKNCLMKLVSPNGTTRIVTMNDFKQDILNNSQVDGVALSTPPKYQNSNAEQYASINRKMTRLRDYFYNNKNGKFLISVASRPDDRIIYNAEGTTGNTGAKVNRCFMYNYNGDTSGRISFYTSDIYAERNTWANSSHFDYIIADAYLRSGNADWDEAREVELLCGNNATITQSFVKNSSDSTAAKASQYTNLTKEDDRTYYYMNVISGRSSIEANYTKKP